MKQQRTSNFISPSFHIKTNKCKNKNSTTIYESYHLIKIFQNKKYKTLSTNFQMDKFSFMECLLHCPCFSISTENRYKLLALARDRSLANIKVYSRIPSSNTILGFL